MSNTRKYFGTDGVRGMVGEFPITPEFALKLGWAAGRVLSKIGTNFTHGSHAGNGQNRRGAAFLCGSYCQ